MNTHTKGLLITTLGVLFVVPDSLFVRVIETDPLIVSFWRGMAAGLFIVIGVLAVQGMSGFSPVIRAGRPAWIYIALIGSTTPAFVMAVTLTSVANVVFVLASMPIFAAIFSFVFLGERIGRRMVLTMLAVAVGLGVIAYGSSSNEIAHWSGDLWALYVAAAFAAGLTAVRQLKDISMIPAIPIGYICGALILAMLVDPFQGFWLWWPYYFAHGAFIAVATCLMTLGPRYISSAEVALLILLESVLAPILVWFVIGEDPGSLALVGGAVVIGALLVSNLVALRRLRG